MTHFPARRLLVASAALAILATAACSEKKAAAPAPAAPTKFKIYVTNERSGDLTVIDGATRQVLATIPLGKRPRGVRLGPDGKTLYIALSGSPIAGPGVDEDKLPPPDKSADGVAVFDIPSGKVVRTITGVSDPEQLAVSKDGKLYVASEDTGQALVIDAASGQTVAAVPVGEEPEGVTLSPDGSQAWVTSEGQAEVTVIDTRTNKALKTIKVGERPRNTAFSPDGRKAYVAGEFDRVVKVVDTQQLEVTNTITLSDPNAKPMGLAVSPAADRVYVSTGRGGMIVALDAASLSVAGSVKVGARPWGIALSPDGRWLYTANGPSNDVSVVDTSTMTVAATIPAGTGPWSMAVVPQ